jgi:threonine aldolase
VYDEDPTVQKLQETAAALLGKEDALFVSSGTMGNLLASMIHGRDRRSEIIVGSRSHVARDEVGGIASVAGVHAFEVPNLSDGTLDMAALTEALRQDPQDIHYSVPRAVYLETTHGLMGGRVPPLAFMASVKRLCGQRATNPVALHCDGARLWNAACALHVSPATVARDVDTVTCCLSKCLGAPAGSVLAGSRAFVAEAKWARKMIGGGMRQIGFLAAAGLFALEKNLSRVPEVHHCAQILASTVAETVFEKQGVRIDMPETNIVFIQTPDPARRDAVVKRCKEEGVMVGPWFDGWMRCVTHVNHSAADAKRAGEVIRDAIRNVY